MINTVLTNGKIDPISIVLLQSFSHLSQDVVSYDPHPGEGAATRFRHFSNFVLNEEGLTSSAECASIFHQKYDFHSAYKNTLPQVIDDSVLEEMKNILYQIAQPFVIKNHSFLIGINQVRMLSAEKKLSYVAPNFHRDGFDFSIHLCVNRNNVLGGMSRIALDVAGKTILTEKMLAPREYLLFDDKYYYHTATPIQNDAAEQIGYRDMLIIDIIKR